MIEIQFGEYPQNCTASAYTMHVVSTFKKIRTPFIYRILSKRLCWGESCNWLKQWNNNDDNNDDDNNNKNKNKDNDNNNNNNNDNNNDDNNNNNNKKNGKANLFTVSIQNVVNKLMSIKTKHINGCEERVWRLKRKAL